MQVLVSNFQTTRDGISTIIQVLFFLGSFENFGTLLEYFLFLLLYTSSPLLFFLATVALFETTLFTNSSENAEYQPQSSTMQSHANVNTNTNDTKNHLVSS